MPLPQEVQQLVDLWEQDSAFRDALRVDPEAAIRARGFTLSPEQLFALKKIDLATAELIFSQFRSYNDPHLV
jgi:hypothetical protein